MISLTGDLFNTDAPYIGHGVNCQGVMGAGIAKTFREKFPNNYKVYKEWCDNGTLRPGGFLLVPEELDGQTRLIVNIASQFMPGADATYENIALAFWKFSQDASRPDRLKRFGNRIAIPEIGCGIGGLEWSKVHAIIHATEIVFPEVEYETWHYE
jgi:O-acetyl-ADP-ribose deacetylase (regulator of RNase III)